MTRRRRGAALLLTTGVALAACSSHRQAPPPPVVQDLTGLDDARQAFETARATVLGDADAIAQDASLRDSLDAHASAGAYDPAVAEGAKTGKADAARAKALKALPVALTTYRAALDQLAAPAASAGLTTAQAAAVRTLVTAARAESSAAEGFARAAQSHWAPYTQLTAAETLWLTRAAAGYYPSQATGLYSAEVAADAYIVFVNPFRDALTAARTALASGTTAIAAETAKVSAAITTLQGQLASLVAPSSAAATLPG